MPPPARSSSTGRGIDRRLRRASRTSTTTPRARSSCVDLGKLHIVNHDFTTVFGPVPLAVSGSSATGYGGPPTIGDFDADGRPEIGIAGARAYAVYDPTLPLSDPPVSGDAVLWQAETSTAAPTAPASTLFDFDDDGSPEVVYGSERNLWIWDGPTGAVRWSRPISSGTTIEQPIVADVDGDSQAELVVHVPSAADGRRHRPPAGITVYDATADDWVRARGDLEPARLQRHPRRQRRVDPTPSARQLARGRAEQLPPAVLPARRHLAARPVHLHGRGPRRAAGPGDGLRRRPPEQNAPVVHLPATVARHGRLPTAAGCAPRTRTVTACRWHGALGLSHHRRPPPDQPPVAGRPARRDRDRVGRDAGPVPRGPAAPRPVARPPARCCGSTSPGTSTGTGRPTRPTARPTRRRVAIPRPPTPHAWGCPG